MRDAAGEDRVLVGEPEVRVVVGEAREEGAADVVVSLAGVADASGRPGASAGRGRAIDGMEELPVAAEKADPALVA